MKTTFLLPKMGKVFVLLFLFSRTRQQNCVINFLRLGFMLQNPLKPVSLNRHYACLNGWQLKAQKCCRLQ